MATADSRNRRIGTDEEFAAIAEYLRGHDFAQQTFTVNGKTYQLTGDGAINNDPFGGAAGTERNPWDTGRAIQSWGIVDADGTVIQRNDGRQVSDIGVSRAGDVKYGDGSDAWRTAGMDNVEVGFGQADNKGQYRNFWKFAAIVAGGAAAGAATGGGVSAVGATTGTGAAATTGAGAASAAGIAGITGADALRLALLAGAVGRSGGGGGGSGGGTAPADIAAGIKPPEAPPAPSAGLGFDPIALFQQNRTRNQTDLNPQRVRPLVAMGNTLLGS